MRLSNIPSTGGSSYKLLAIVPPVAVSTIRHVSECLTSEFGIRTYCVAVPAKAHILYLILIYQFATIIDMFKKLNYYDS